MLPGAASVMRQAIRSPCSAKAAVDGGAVVVGQHQGQRGGGRRDAGRAGHREGGQPEPAAASSESTWPW